MSTSQFKIAIIHEPPYTSQTMNFSDLRWPFRAWGCDLVLSGHVLNYKRLIVNGFPYVGCGWGGRPLEEPLAPTSGSLVQIKSYGYIRLDVTNFGLTVRFV